MDFKSSLQSLITRAPAAATHEPQPGVYHYLRETREGKARLHLRLEPDGSGLLLVNASRVYQLNPSAAYRADLSLEAVSSTAAIAAVTRRYKVAKTQAQQDFAG